MIIYHNFILPILLRIHPHPLVGSIALLGGVFLGLGLACSNWKSKLAMGSMITAAVSFIGSLTTDKWAIVEKVVNETFLLTPVLLLLNIAFVTFVILIGIGTFTVFVSNYISAKRKGDPEALVLSTKRALTVLSSGLREYVTESPDIVARNKIKELESSNDVLEVLYKILVAESSSTSHSKQHFEDVIAAAGRTLLQTVFGEGAELSHYRLAFFLVQGDRLEYCVTVNNNDWTAHSRNGFDIAKCFMGEALKRDQPLIFPKDKARKVSFDKRRDSRYQSFIAVPVPCGMGNNAHVGIVTVDYTGTDEVFTEKRRDLLFAFSQLVFCFYKLNMAEAKNDGNEVGNISRVK